MKKKKSVKGFCSMLSLCAYDVGLRYNAGSAVIAAEICKKYNRPYDSGDRVKIVMDHYASLRHSGKKIKPHKADTPIPRSGSPHPEYARDPGFYLTKEWRQLRYLALRNAKGCQSCGATAKDGVKIHVDHITPRYKRPDLSLSLDNLQVLCADCNLGKGAWDDTDWR
jgi:hypothetical protein